MKIVTLFGVLCILAFIFVADQKAKRDTRDIDVCADKPTPSEIEHCRHLIQNARSVR